MRRLFPTALAVTTLAMTPAIADEFTDTLDSALEAYSTGDITGARADLDYAAKLLTALKAESLAKFLPAAPAGWTRADADDAEAGGMMAMFGGGTTASASYTRGGDEMTLTLVASSPMVSGMAAMVGGLAAMGGGKPMRIQRTEFSLNDQDLQGVVDGKVLVSVSGNAAVEDKTALLETMDFSGLADF
jgi:hypothetical protein